MATLSTTGKRLTSGFYMLMSLPSTAMGFGLSVQISALSWILSTKYNLDIHEVGYVWAAGPLAGIFGQLIVGVISDRVWFWGGRRRPFIVIGGIIAAACLLLLPRLTEVQEYTSISSLIAVGIIVALALDLAINIGFNPTRSIIADLTPEGEARTKGYTWMQTVSGTFGVAAYAIAAIWGNLNLIWVGAILVFVASVIPALLLKEPRQLAPVAPEAQAENDSESVAPASTNWGHFGRVFIAHAFTWLGIQTMFIYTFAFIKQYMSDGDDDLAGQIIAIAFLVFNAVAAVLPKFVLEPISRKIGKVRVHMICIASMAAAYFLLGFVGTSPAAMYAIMAILGIGWAATVSLPFAIFSERVDKTRMGFFMGFFNLSVVLPQLVASFVIGGIIQDAPDTAITYYISGGALAISAALWLLVPENK